MAVVEQLLGHLDVPTVLIFVVFLLFLVAQRKPPRYPPGPWRWPIVGNIPTVIRSKFQARDFKKISEKYGPVFSLKMGALDLVVMNGYEAIHEAFSQKADMFIGRPHDKLYIVQRSIGKKGLFMNEGTSWYDLRKMIAVSLREFGVGQKTIEERIHEECQAIFEVLDTQQKGRPLTSVKLQTTLMTAVSNIICSIAFGDRFQYTDKRFVHLMDLLNTFFRTNPLAIPENSFPFLRHIRPQSQAEYMISIQESLRDFVREQVDHHKETFDPDNVRDVVDLYLRISANETKQDTSFSNDSMLRAVVDLFAAGSETTSLSTNWAILFLLYYPESQRKLYEEIIQVIGNGRRPSLQDKPNMPYTQAFISEMLRVGNIASTSAPHSAVDDVEVCGYVIPKRTICFANLFSVHMNPKEWPEPEEFRPERWIDKDGKFYKPSKAFLPFSLGPRACLGEQLARMEVFIFLTSMLQQFSFSSPDGEKPPNPLPSQSGITTTPPPYELCITRRE